MASAHQAAPLEAVEHGQKISTLRPISVVLSGVGGRALNAREPRLTRFLAISTAIASDGGHAYVRLRYCSIRRRRLSLHVLVRPPRNLQPGTRAQVGSYSARSALAGIAAASHMSRRIAIPSPEEARGGRLLVRWLARARGATKAHTHAHGPSVRWMIAAAVRGGPRAVAACDLPRRALPTLQPRRACVLNSR